MNFRRRSIFAAALVCFMVPQAALAEAMTDRPLADRSPVDLVVLADDRLLVTANQSADSLSLVDIDRATVLDEVPCGDHPVGIALSSDGQRIAATANYSGELMVFAIDDQKLKRLGAVQLGFAPRGVVLAPGGQTAYVALSDAGAIAIVDLNSLQLTSKIEVGPWPRYLALSPDGSRLAVGASGQGGVTVVDTQRRAVLYRENFAALNLGQLQVTADGLYAYLPWVAYGSNPITAQNIRRGWVIASRIARVRLDGPARREAIALDKRGQAVGDPHGLALSPDESHLVVTAGGSHELLVFRRQGLPFQDYGGPGDTIDERLAGDSDRFFRVPLGGRPLGVRFAKDGRRVFVANYLENTVQVVGLAERKVIQTIRLGGPPRPSLARRGEAIFYDAGRSLDQWFSCHTCHYEGGSNAVKMDTTNDGGFGTFKTVLDLHNVTKTGPWTWHGWQTDLRAALAKSLTETMLGPAPSDADLEALAAFLESLPIPPNPYRLADGSLSAAARRGKQVFESDSTGCSRCHRGTYFTDGQIHDVGLGSTGDRYQGFNTPSLIGVHRRLKLLHDGRAACLEEVLRGPHEPTLTGGGPLSDSELADLIEYVRSL
jgi:DNA-binding beta-propeller fold protein YncE/mono/diheme cytochrome c family protein